MRQLLNRSMCVIVLSFIAIYAVGPILFWINSQIGDNYVIASLIHLAVISVFLGIIVSATSGYAAAKETAFPLFLGAAVMILIDYFVFGGVGRMDTWSRFFTLAFSWTFFQRVVRWLSERGK